MSATDDLFAPDPTPPARERAGYVLCEFGAIAFAVPQRDVLTIEQTGELAAAMPGERAMGWFESAQGPWPAYALNDDLQPIRDFTGARGFIVFVRATSGPIGLLCETVRIIGNRDDMRSQELPSPLDSVSNALQGVSRLSNTRLAYVLADDAAGVFLTELTHPEGLRRDH